MSAELQIFADTEHELRVIKDENGDPWFHMGDLCRALEHTNPTVAARMLEGDEHRLLDMRDIAAGQTALNFKTPPTGNAMARFVSESGFYTLAFNSRARGAAAFRRWVTAEVLPTIRRTGGYGAQQTPRELSRLELIELARDSELRRIEALQRAEVAETRALELEEPAAKYQQFMDADGTYGLNDVAKIIGGPGRTGLMQLMREDGILTRDNLPLQRHIDNGRFVVKVSRPWKMPDGTERVSRSTRVTAKGLDWLAQKYGPSGPQLLMIAGGGGEW